MTDVLHDTVHCAGEVDLVLVVHGDGDEEFGLAGVADVLAQFVSTITVVVWVACDGRVSHVRELDVVSSWKETVEDSRDFTLENEFTVNQANLLLCHYSVARSTSFLCAIGSRPVVLCLLIHLGVDVCVCVVGHVRVARSQVRSIVANVGEGVVVVVNGYRSHISHVHGALRAAGVGSATGEQGLRW